MSRDVDRVGEGKRTLCATTAWHGTPESKNPSFLVVEGELSISDYKVIFYLIA